ncbi:MAG TPA: cytochrome c oxidase subunit 3 family protein [Terracidiphilus sp.]|nr:cytochrome c oxidase subunit 3 family protein [Terracidiphilus sp.]
MSDSTVTVTGAHAEHEHPPYQRHHFASMEQQVDTTSFAMWLFLLTEIMFFGGLFTAYLIFRNWYYPAFVEASHQLSIKEGTANTAVLIVSSFTMAMGVWCAETRRRGALVLCLCLTFILGLVFLGIKYDEYHEKYEKHHVPGLHYSLKSFTDPASDPEVHNAYPDDKPLMPDMARHTEIYFGLYFAMTGMHALHMIIGISILAFMIFRARAGAYTTGHVTFVNNFGLYWHFVDIIWIFLYPLLYLISRHA